jgi:hypothetical protein
LRLWVGYYECNKFLDCLKLFTSPARKGSNSVKNVLRGSKSKSKTVEKRTGPGARASTFGFDFQVRAIVEGTVPVAAVIAIRRIGLLYRRRMMKQDSEASFCFKVGYCFKVNVQMSTSLKSRDFVL